MSNFTPGIGAAEITRALLNAGFGFVEQGGYLRKGRCPNCGKPELFVSTEEPWVVKCGRLNNCGWEEKTRDLLPELFEEFSSRYKATEQEPDRTAAAYLGMNRGFDLSKMKDWFEQGAFLERDTNSYLNTVRFYLTEDKSIYWERFIDKRPKDGRKANFVGKWKGLCWTPPGFELEDNDRCYLVEGCFHAVALRHMEEPVKAAACLSCGTFPERLIKENKGRGITWVIALDGDPAGRRGAKKHALRLKAMGEKVEVLILPDNGKDWDDYYREKALTKQFLRDGLYRGRLYMAESVEEKAYHFYQRHPYRTFILDFRSALYGIEIDSGALEMDLNPRKKEDGEAEPAPIELSSKAGWDVFIRYVDVDQISNIFPRFLYMERDEIMEEQRYVFQIEYANGNPSDIIGLEGTNITSPDALHKALLNKSRGGTFDGEVKQLKILRDRWLNSKMKTVTSIPFVGYDRDTGAYVFQQNAYHKGREIKLNRDGYFQVGKTGIKTSLNGVAITTDGKSIDWLENYHKAFHWQGMVLLSFWLGSLFAQQVRARHKSWPFCEFTGEPGAGKSTALEFLWKCYGRDDYEGFDVMKATPAGRRRAFNQVSNFPVVIIESDRDDGTKDAKAKQFDFDLCKPFFNGRGTGTLGVSRRNNDVEESLFQAALIISQNAEVDGSEALLQRIVHVHVDKRHHRPDSRDIARWFERQTSSEVGGFLRQALRNERRILQVYEEAFPKYEALFGKSEKIHNERIIKNHAQVAAFGDALAVMFPASMTKDRQEKLATYILGRAEARELRLAHDHPMLEQFWESYDYLNTQHPTKVEDFLNHSNKPDELAINLEQYREMCLKHGQELPDLRQLKKLLPNGKRHKFVESGRAVNSRHLEKTVRCWIFKK